MLMRAATVVQVLYVLLQLLVVAATILSFKFYCKFYCMFYFTCDRSFIGLIAVVKVRRSIAFCVQYRSVFLDPGTGLQ